MKKPENMTSLTGTQLVPKTHPRIALRGKLDSLQAEIVLLQAEADAAGAKLLIAQLEEILVFLRAMMRTEVTGEPLVLEKLFSMTPDALRDASHACYQSFRQPEPLYTMGRLPAALNLLRAHVRETELAAAHAEMEGGSSDILLALNRLSSAVYVLFCRQLHQEAIPV